MGTCGNTIGLGLAALVLAAVSAAAFASGGSYFVDDATATPAGHCQLESWARAYSGGAEELTAVPACSIERFELSAQATRIAHDGSNVNLQGIGAKWLLRDFDMGNPGVGLATSALWSGGRLGSVSYYVPVSFALNEAHSMAVHLNAGARRDLGDGWHAVLGAAAEFALPGRLQGTAEFIRAVGAESIVQIGGRCALNQNSAIDLVLGQSRDKATRRWLTLGLNLAF